MAPDRQAPDGQAGGGSEQLTARQRRILDFIGQTVRERGYPPTVREIGEAVGLTSSSSVHAQLATLERRGLLRKDPTKPRAMALSETPRAEGVVVPLVGRIAAGAPVLADEHVEDHLVVPMGFAGDAEHFALTVRGDSMIEAGILDGDLVIVRAQATAADGDIVAVLLPGPAEDEATVKRLSSRRGRVMLVPENAALEPFEMDPGGRILGKVVSVLRRL
ncbi:MAG TPA: transcriptional repressor LexA [Actinomycetota bacterium]|jgi:repressor LexA|nr:transcriptional repressor LexA [Actinomycetota bacterium]